MAAVPPRPFPLSWRSALDAFSTVIRVASHEQHTEAETSTFMSDLLGGRLGVDAYTRYTEQLWFVYRALEEAAESLKDDPVAGPFIRPELMRVAEIERDLAHLLGPQWRRNVVALPSTEAYAARVAQCAAEWPGGYVAHHYTRYLGDLSGGQIIRDKAERTWGFERKGDGVRFYVFADISNPAAVSGGREHPQGHGALWPQEHRRGGPLPPPVRRPGRRVRRPGAVPPRRPAPSSAPAYSSSGCGTYAGCAGGAKRTRPPTSIVPSAPGAVRIWEPAPWVMFSARSSWAVSRIAADPVASSSAMTPSGRRGKPRARTRPAASSSHAQAYSQPSPGGGAGSASTSATLAYCWVRLPSTHSGRAVIQVNSPSSRAQTDPTGGWSSSMSSNHATPTSGCPAKDIRVPGVRMSTTPRSGSSTNTVSL